MKTNCRVALKLSVCGIAWLALDQQALAQSSSLFGEPSQRALTLEDAFTFIPTPEPPTIGLNDIVTVVVKDAFQYTNEGELVQRKLANLEATLEDWIELDGLNIQKAPQDQGDPKVSGELNSQYRAISEMETTGGVQFRITARVVDIRPNGNLVLEARKEVVDNEDVWEQRLTGEVRPEDIAPDNTVFSEKLADLRIEKSETGSVRDGYKRGWFKRMYERFSPF